MTIDNKLPISQNNAENPKHSGRVLGNIREWCPRYMDGLLGKGEGLKGIVVGELDKL